MRRGDEPGRDEQPPVDASGGLDPEATLTRREALRAGAGAAALVTLEADPARARIEPKVRAASVPGGRWESSFDEDWRFLLGDPSGAEAPSFDDSGWRKLDVPHDWQAEDLPYATSDDGGATTDPAGWAWRTDPSADGVAPSPIGAFDANAEGTAGVGLFNSGGRSQGWTVTGVGWYRKHFTVPAFIPDEPDRQPDGDDQRIELRFDGVYQDADFWLNGTHLGFHPNGYVSFAFDITPYLKPRGQENVLAVRVNTSGQTSRWYAGSGIYRHTWLTVRGPVHIPLWGVYVTTPQANQARSVVHAEVEVTNFAGRLPAKLRVSVVDAHGRKIASRTTAARTIASGATRTFAADITVRNAALWSPDSPTLYTARAEVLVGGKVVDTLDTKFGIRSLVFNGKDGFLLNGNRFVVKGGNIHHDHGPLGSVALGRAEERKIEILKAAGFNAMRTAHNPRSPLMLDACDRLGILVWNEFSDMWDSSKGGSNDYSKYFNQWWQRDLAAMVRRDRNHPSVTIWSIGNEIEHGRHNGRSREARKGDG